MNDADEINNWLISEGRTLGDGAAIVDGYLSRLVEAGVPLARANIAQRFANPLLVAWGVIWTPESSTEYDVTHEMLETDAYVGSPFEYVLTNEKPLHKSLTGLNKADAHKSYIELAEGGGTDLFATYLLYGDGSKNGCTYITNNIEGFRKEDIDIIQATRFGLASALEPVTMRRSTESLLRTYIGSGPASAVSRGTIQRGGHVSVTAVVMFTDLRGFTSKTEKWGETRLLDALNGYFDIVVQSVEENGGDVLKFMGDGILSIFKIDDTSTQNNIGINAVKAAKVAIEALETLNVERKLIGEEALAIGIGLNIGPVTYGNIGSPHRLDFTVLGPAVNVASRVQDLCKEIGSPVLATELVSNCCASKFTSSGFYEIRGVEEPIEVFSLNII